MNIQFIFDSLEKKKSKPLQDYETFREKTKEQISVRDKSYTDLLSHFVGITKVRNWARELFKWGFLLTIIYCMIILSKYLGLIFKKYVEIANIQEIISSIPLLMTSIIGFVSAIIGIPTIITKYLFSTDEDKYITNIILHTQKHDTSGRKWADGITSPNAETDDEAPNDDENQTA